MSDEIQSQIADDTKTVLPDAPEVNDQTSESDAVDQDITETPAESVDKKDPWYKRRIDELTKEKYEARRHAERMEQLYAKQQQVLEQFQPPPSQPTKIQAPDPAQYAGGIYDPRYMEDRFAYAEAVAEEKASQRFEQLYEQRVAQQRQQEHAQRLEAAEAAARTKFADYDVAIEGIVQDPTLSSSEVIRQVVLGANGPEIAYMLGKNLDVAYEIANLDPISAGMKIAEMMNRTPRKTTNAPTPIRPLSQAGSTPSRKTTAEMTTEEFIQYRNAQELEARRARIVK